MTNAGSQAWAFYRDVAKNKAVWTIRDKCGFPAPKNAEGRRTQPFWSTKSRVEKIINTVPAYSEFEPYEIPWEYFCSNWVPGLMKEGLLAGVNWSGKEAMGYDLEPKQLQEYVQAIMNETNENS